VWGRGRGEGEYLKGEEAVRVVMAGTQLGVKQRTHRMHRLQETKRAKRE
jgi:hypothetical protein